MCFFYREMWSATQKIKEVNHMEGMKFTIVGAGSSYTPELLDEMANRFDCFSAKQ